MTNIRQEDLIASIADALQFISYLHPLDFIHAMARPMKESESGGQRRHGPDPQ